MSVTQVFRCRRPFCGLCSRRIFYDDRERGFYWGVLGFESPVPKIPWHFLGTLGVCFRKRSVWTSRAAIVGCTREWGFKSRAQC